MRSIRLARGNGFGAFDTNRAESAIYEDDVFFELQGFLNMRDCGITNAKRRFGRLRRREQTPHGDTHLRTIKKLATPEEAQSDDGTVVSPAEIEEWRHIRDHFLDPFQGAVGRFIEQSQLKNAIQGPVNVAIDEVVWPCHRSPWQDMENVDVGDEYVWVEVDGEEKRK